MGLLATTRVGWSQCGIGLVLAMLVGNNMLIGMKGNCVVNGQDWLCNIWIIVAHLGSLPMHTVSVN